MKKAILIAAFGTTHMDTAEKTIFKMVEDVQEKYPDIPVYLGYTSKMVVKALGGRVMNVEGAFVKMRRDGVSDVRVCSLHLIKGYEYEKLLRTADMYSDKFNSIKVSCPLLAQKSDRERTAAVMMKYFCGEDGRYTILMGHGTEHKADFVYGDMNDIFEKNNACIRTASVEGQIKAADVLEIAKSSGARSVILTPLMLTAGEHAKNDMAGEWKDIFESNGFETECVIKGLGEYGEIREIYLEHLDKIMAASGVFYGVGVGPGDPELLTVKAIRAIRECPVIAVPVTNGRNTMALDIAASVSDLSQKEILELDFPMTRDSKKTEQNHEAIAGIIEKYLDEGKDVAMLNIGDPSLYSTYSYIRDKLCKRGRAAETIAGVPSFCACAAAAGVNLTSKKKPLVILPAAYGGYEEYLDMDASFVIMKPSVRNNDTEKVLEKKGLGECSVTVKNCGLENELVTYGIPAEDEEKSYFTTIMINKDR